MGQAANSNRRATLDDKKRRAAGRQNATGPEREAIREAYSDRGARGKVGGAFGADTTANPRGRGGATRGGGGGGGSQSRAKAAPYNTPRRKTPARKGGI